jgi:hypothetical protein
LRDDLGEDTRDILALGQPHPSERKLAEKEREDAVQKAGRRYRRTGFTLLILACVTALAAAVIAEGQVFHNPTAQLFAGLSTFALIAIGAILTSAGINERRNQSTRAMLRQALARGERNEQRLDRLLQLVDSNAERLDAIERQLEKVRRFEDGVELGAELRRAVMGGDNT